MIGDFIQPSIIHYQMQRAIFLLYKEHEWIYLDYRLMLNKSIRQVLFNIISKSFEFW